MPNDNVVPGLVTFAMIVMEPNGQLVLCLQLDFLPDEQIVGILREVDRDGVATVAKWHATSEQAIYALKKRFGTFEVSNVRRLKALEHDNARLKKLVAERDLEIEVMKGIAAKKW